MQVLDTHESRSVQSARPSPHPPSTPDRLTVLRPNCSIGVMAYNEEANIAKAIQTVLGQDPDTADLSELIVVASGCTDRTADIVESMARDDGRIRLVIEPQRKGKASAINLFLEAARYPIVLLMSADILVQDGAIDALLGHFDDPGVGMVGGHPVPINDDRDLVGYAVHLLWRLHDAIAREDPKLGEIVAFRNLLTCIPTDTAVDELSIQALITRLGYRLVYEPRAVIYNRGPATIGDYLRQRRRICAGHLQVARHEGYAASTMSVSHIAQMLVESEWSAVVRAPLRTSGAVALEAAARALGYYDYLRRQPHNVWATATTTKDDIAKALDGHGGQNVLVFQLINFTARRLELGARVAHHLLTGIVRQIEQHLGPNVRVSGHDNGTIVAVLGGNASAAEDAARSLVQKLAANENLVRASRGDEMPVQLACGIITFPPAGPPLARPVLA